MICPGREAGFRPAGVYGFAVDPDLDATVADVFWRPDVAPAAIVIVAPASPFATDSLRLELTPERTRNAAEGDYLRESGGLQVLLVNGARLDESVSIVLPLDRYFDARVAAAQALHQAVRSGGAPAQSITDQRRWRFGRMLRALDGREAGASYRDVAEGVLGEAYTDSMAWRTSSARDVAIRLCRGAAKLMSDGYLTLLGRRS